MNNAVLAGVAAFGLATTAACGGGGPNAADYVGTYNMDFTITVTILGMETPQMSTETLTVTQGTDSDLVLMRDSCPLKANLTTGGSFTVSEFDCMLSVSSVTAQAQGTGEGSANGSQLTLMLTGVASVAGIPTSLPFRLSGMGVKQ